MFNLHEMYFGRLGFKNYLVKFYQFKRYLWIYVIITTSVDNLFVPKMT